MKLNDGRLKHRWWILRRTRVLRQSAAEKTDPLQTHTQTGNNKFNSYLTTWVDLGLHTAGEICNRSHNQIAFDKLQNIYCMHEPLDLKAQSKFSHSSLCSMFQEEDKPPRTSKASTFQVASKRQAFDKDVETSKAWCLVISFYISIVFNTIFFYTSLWSNSVHLKFLVI